LGKIIRLDFRQTRRANFRQARGFIEREPAGQARVLKFFAQAFNCHVGFRRLNGGIEIDQDLTGFGTFAGPQNTALL
jgi:hypothetical protein